MRTYSFSTLFLFAAILVATGCTVLIDRKSDDLPSADGGNGTTMDADVCELFGCTCDTNAQCTGVHEICDMTMGRRCDCAPGFGRASASDPCAFVPQPSNPEVSDTAAWTSVGGAFINPNDPGFVPAGGDLGLATFSSNSLCNAASISAHVTVPAAEQGVPLVLELVYRNQDPVNGSAQLGIAVELGSSFSYFAPSSTATKVRVCLGTSSYGHEFDLRVTAAGSPSESACAGGITETLEVDRVGIVLAEPDECGPVGELSNADFEGAGPGWTTTQSGSGMATIAAPFGRDGSIGGRLTTTTQCSGATLTNKASWASRERFASPALRFWSNIANGTAVQMLTNTTGFDYGGNVVGSVTGSGTSGVQFTVCIPPWLQGQASTFVLSLPNNGGSCGVAQARSANLDDFAFVNEPDCGTDPYVLDGGFELASNVTAASSWSFSISNTQTTAFAGLAVDPSNAANGNGVLRLTTGQICTDSQALGGVVVPRGDTSGGPALRFRYKTSLASSTASPAVRIADSSMTLPLTTTYSTITLCLTSTAARNLAGEYAGVTFANYGGGGACANTYPAMSFYVDEMEMVLDPSCL